MNYNVDEKGYYGDFGGAFIPEMLYPNVAELRKSILKLRQNLSSKRIRRLLKNYVGRPTPLYFAKDVIGKIQHQNLSQTRRFMSYRSA